VGIRGRFFRFFVLSRLTTRVGEIGWLVEGLEGVVPLLFNSGVLGVGAVLPPVRRRGKVSPTLVVTLRAG